MIYLDRPLLLANNAEMAELTLIFTIKQSNPCFHHVLVLLLFAVAPSLRLEPSSGPIVVRSGTTVALKCKTTEGNPQPRVTWRKRNDRLPDTAEVRNTLTNYTYMETILVSKNPPLTLYSTDISGSW